MSVLRKEALGRYLASLYGAKVKVNPLREFKSDETGQEFKEFGYGSPVFIEFSGDGEKDSAVLHTMKPSAFGHETQRLRP